MAMSYGQFCPVATAAEIVCERWNALIIRELVCGCETFNDIRMGVTRISPTLLSARLKSLERAGVLRREQSGRNVTYKLTTAGEDLRPVITALGVWGQRWARSDMSRRHLDPGYLMWDIRRRIDIGRFPDKRVVLKFEFSDYAARQRFWWLVVNRGEVDLCRTDPGYEISLFVTSRLRVLTEIWMGDISLRRALRDKLVQVSGDAALKKTMKSWFTLSVVADIKRGRA